MLEDNPTTNLASQTVTRLIYVLDTASGKRGTRVDLDIYQKTDVISGSDDHVTVTLANTVTLPLIGGATATASMAGNTNADRLPGSGVYFYLVVGTTLSPQVVEVTKSSLAVAQFGGFSPPINVHAVTADAYGYITVEFGKFSGTDTAFIVLGPDGATKGDGGGAPFMLNTTQAVVPSMLR
jgi:hypothetical protein